MPRYRSGNCSRRIWKPNCRITKSTSKRQALPHVNLLTGVRVVSLDYSASITGQQVVLGGILARNRLIGWQLGVEAELYQRGPFSIDTTWKGGIYHNDAKTNIVVPMMGTLANDGGETSFLTDFWFKPELSVVGPDRRSREATR